LRKKDAEQALLFEEKMNLQMRLLQAANVWSGNESDNEKIEKPEKEGADYTRLVHNEGTDTTQLWQEVSIIQLISSHPMNIIYKLNYCGFLIYKSAD